MLTLGRLEIDILKLTVRSLSRLEDVDYQNINYNIIL